MAEYPIHFAGIAIETLPTGAHRWPCAAHGAIVTAFCKPNGRWVVSAACRACNQAALQPVLDAIEAAKKKKAPPVDDDGASDVVWRDKGNTDANAHHSTAQANGNGHDPAQAITLWKASLFATAEALLHKDVDLIKADPQTQFRELVKALDISVRLHPSSRAPMVLSASELLEELEAVATAAVGEIAPAELPGPSAIVCEDYETAVAANAEYLKRVPIVDRLFFTQTISLVVGGKHHGKTTIARTAAMSIMRGLPFLGREVKRGPVIYAASSDEVPVTRMELLRMGWDSRRDPLRIVHIRPDGPDVDQVLGEISDLAIKEGAVFIVLDMLFDFAQIRDEMSYAGTRQAIGKVQALADKTLASVVPTHHSPKYMTDAATAGQSALGSQGIAARFSPIILSRKWARGFTAFRARPRATRAARRWSRRASRCRRTGGRRAPASSRPG
jgi:hypothetical protein